MKHLYADRQADKQTDARGKLRKTEKGELGNKFRTVSCGKMYPGTNLAFFAQQVNVIMDVVKFGLERQILGEFQRL